MTTVHFKDRKPKSKSYKSATVKSSGWVFCYKEDDRYHAYPPHMIERITDCRTDEDGERVGKGLRLTAESPHGRV